MSLRAPARTGAPRPPSGLPRLLAGLDGGGAATSLESHLAQWGPAGTGQSRGALLDAVEHSGLRGRGGAWFPAAVKWRAVAARRMRRPVVVVNAAEGEPASAKDRHLLSCTPHLVLDGAAVAAVAVGAGRVVAYVPPALAGWVAAAAAERRLFSDDPVEVEVVASAERFVAGEESAVVAQLNGGPGGLPAFTALRPVYERGVAGRPTLVQNAETLAHAALIARYGPAWFRRAGTEASPGTALLTVTGPGDGPQLVEIGLGTPLGRVLRSAGADPSELGAVLLGGYGGAWLPAAGGFDVPLCEEELRRVGATLGAGVIGVVGRSHCPLAETARIARYLAGQSAGQCGPCVHGLPALADALEALAFRPSTPGCGPDRLRQLCDLVEGRGACHHPDGTARMVRSALRAFPGEVERHLHDGPCPRVGRPGVLPA